MTISLALLAETIETLERVGCQFWACDGPTLEPVDMKTCYACETLAKLRVAAGRPARTSDDLTAEEAIELRQAISAASATGRRARDILTDRGFAHLTSLL